MKKLILIGLILIGGIAFVYTRYSGQMSENLGINEVSTSSDTQEQAFQASQETSTSTSLESIESDLSNTIIQDEDYSDLE